MTAIVFAVVGQHRDDPSRLLLLGEDGRHYAYDASGRTSPAPVDETWRLDLGDEPVARDQSFHARSAGSAHERPARAGAPRSRPRSVTSGLAAGLIAALLSLLIGLPAAAHAPALAVAVADAEIRSAPEATAVVAAELAVGDTVELTGAAASGYVEVTISGEEIGGWVPLIALDAGGLETATVSGASVLLAEPRPGAAAVHAVPAGATLLLTGAEVDGFHAAAFEGIAGWVSAEALGR